MAEEHILIDDILRNQKERMMYLKKYYPFFVLQETSLSQYKDGQYQDLDMGYITMALLRFLIQENQMNGRAVTYPEIEKFLKNVLRRDFDLRPDRGSSPAYASDISAGGQEDLPRTMRHEADDEAELIRFLFDKIRNDGRPFIFHFYDPESRMKQQGYVRLVESTVQDGEVTYSITADGIEFYLSTKEVRDESTISTEQLLLEKMIRTENFRGGIDVVRRINLEVSRLRKEREAAVHLLRTDIRAGVAACETYMEGISKWFDQERESFRKNKALVDKAVAKTANAYPAGTPGAAESAAVRSRNAGQDIAALETELKKTIESHRLLMEEAASLIRMADEMVERSKARQLRPAFDFLNAQRMMREQDRPDEMGLILAPLLMPRRRKSLSVFSIDKLVSEAREEEALTEKQEKAEPDHGFVYEDEKLSRLIGENFVMLFRELLDRLTRWGTVTLSEFNAILEIKFGKEIYRNRDYYSFLVHLSKKDRYRLEESFTEPETFLEAYAARSFSDEEKQRFRNLTVAVDFGSEEIELIDDMGEPQGTVRTMTFSSETTGTGDGNPKSV